MAFLQLKRWNQHLIAINATAFREYAHLAADLENALI
jgi:hypothetical protein